MAKSYISKQQLVKLQVLYGQSAAGRGQDAGDRTARLAWASDLVGREVRSFNDLTRKEAALAIDALQGNTHHRDTETQNNQARGTEGRKPRAKGQRPTTKSVTMAGAEDLARIQDALSRLGWDEKRFEAWLRSPTSPLGRKSSPKIRTVWEANRVWWALKRLLQRAGEWHEEAGGRGRGAGESGGPEAA